MLLNPEKLTAIYWYCAILGTVIFLLKSALPIDTGTEVSGDFTSVDGFDTSFNLFTIEGIAAFFMCAGWMGWLSFSQLHYELKISVLISVVSGAIGMFFFAWLIAQFKKLEHDPKPDLGELSGKSGKAYVQFPPNGVGKIQIEFNSKLQILDAKNITQEQINAFDPVKVIKIEKDNIFIEKEKN